MPEHPIPRMFKQLAESIVNPNERQKSVQHAIDIMEGKDPEVRPPMMDSGGMAGLTRRQAVESVLGLLQGGKAPEHVKDSFAKTIQVLLKGAPRGALQDLESITMVPPRKSYSSVYQAAPFEEAMGMGGSHFAKDPKFNLKPRIELQPEREREPRHATSLGLPNAIDEVFPHELGHEVTSRLIQRLAKRYGMGENPTELERLLYAANKPMYEAWADTLGELMRRKAGITEPLYRPQSQYGEVGQLSTEMRENLRRGQSKNPYLDLRSWLERDIQNLGYTKGGR